MSESYCNQTNQDTVPFSTLAAEIAISLPMVTEPIVMAAIFRASTDFLSKTRVLKEVIDIDYINCTPDYPLEASQCNTIVNVAKVWLNGHELEDGWSRNSDGWIELDECLTNYCDGTPFKAEVVLSLSKDTCAIPKEIYERFGDGIMNMTLSRLYGMFGEDWYNPEMVRFYGGIGRQSVSDAKSLIQLDQTRGCIELRGSDLIL